MEKVKELKELYNSYISYYQFHHNEKMRMFLYYIISETILIIPIVLLMATPSEFYQVICIVGIVLSLIFIALDYDKDTLLKSCKKELVHLESIIYKDLKINEEEVIGVYRKDLIVRNDTLTKYPITKTDTLYRFGYLVFIVANVFALLQIV
ncbi:hypothetical protein CI105_07520 [Candidatus Izimaplasma bacterium ZiA1]|uniref:hypothetical protein n=1 Tax=Candidatus Izimoplasma sp. ZiA1 TaxID=2024899 RepID=UPI000BAA8EE0|nr:hypothetical protein CI105_07520 [Candidatus Izimaplasma bacterium ZiA1]